MELVHVPGENRGWCARTKDFLADLGVEYSYLYVDLLKGEERDRVVREVERWNPRLSFPTVVINDAKVVVGYQENEIREALNA